MEYGAFAPKEQNDIFKCIVLQRRQKALISWSKGLIICSYVAYVIVNNMEPDQTACSPREQSDHK